MPYGKDDNENKGRKSGKGPKLSKGMKKAARQEKKTARKTAKKTKKVIKKLAKAVSKEVKKKENVSRFVGSQPTIGKVAKAAPIQVPVRKVIPPLPLSKMSGGSAYASGFETREKKKPTKKKELTRGQKRSYELKDAHS
jgi:hypothetical protein